MRRTVRRRLQRMRQGRDRILPTPEDAAVLQGVVRLVRELPLWGGRLLLVCCEWAHQGVIRLSPPVLALVEHVMDRWNDLVRCVRNPSVPSGTNLPGAGLAAQAPGAAGPRPQDAAGRTVFPALAGRKPGLKPAGPPGSCQRSRSCPTEPFSTKVKQCRTVASRRDRRCGIMGVCRPACRRCSCQPSGPLRGQKGYRTLRTLCPCLGTGP